MSGNFDINKTVSDAYDEALRKRGVANILIAGKTGVGKSTLINTVFQGRMAATGQGRPVTQCTKKITKEGVPVAVYDTKGLEVEDYDPILKELMGFIKATNSNSDHQQHIHAAWICIAEGARRVEEAEISLARNLSEVMPVVVVVTTATSDQGFKRVVEGLFPFARNVVRVNSIELVLDGGLKIPAYGLEDLIDITMEVIPEGQKKAFAAAQQIKLDHKLNQSHKVVAAAAASAAGIAAVPIPFSDAIGIVPIQIGMLAGISLAFGLDANKAFLGALVSGTFTAVAGSFGGRAAVGALLKFFPGLGSAAGAAVSATVAATITTTFGEAYVATLYSLIKDDPDKKLSGDDVAKAFKEKLQS
ncbi:GTPase [Pseudomonas nitroreducens]|uniref:GTPase n=1 Tax=Pseudomonas nitroreducens TaxID=46680 RepID=UPI001FB76586|nr:GTPase [Pseudomonas nitroreducens]MCJ1881871.1 50S ribosome-binding GTPase [Pseudomonas nitroreducens]MCJ1898287.1 50S ribosome-binding GTPase [Pseudomonas nitroreducens]